MARLMVGHWLPRHSKVLRPSIRVVRRRRAQARCRRRLPSLRRLPHVERVSRYRTRQCPRIRSIQRQERLKGQRMHWLCRHPSLPLCRLLWCAAVQAARRPAALRARAAGAGRASIVARAQRAVRGSRSAMLMSSVSSATLVMDRAGIGALLWFQPWLKRLEISQTAMAMDPPWTETTDRTAILAVTRLSISRM